MDDAHRAVMGKTFVFSTYGARGDIFPYLAIALELRRRGHRAVIATSEKYRHEVESRGLDFHAIRPDSPSGADAQRMMHPILGTEFLFRNLLLPPIHDSIADLRAAVQGADVLITHTTSLAGPMVAELEAPNGLKWVSAIVSPLALLEEDVALPALPRFADFPVLNRAVLFLLWRQLGMKLRETQEIRAGMGISRGDNVIWSDGHSPTLQLCLWDEKFAPVSGHPVRKAVGFCTLDESETLSAEIEDFVINGDPPLLFVSASFAHSRDWEVQSIAAAEKLRMRAILVGTENFSIGSDDLRCPFLPLQQVVPHVAAMVHFGGIGTLALGLKVGLPMLLTPKSHDQPDNGRRTHKLGIGRVMALKNYKAAKIAQEIKELREDRALARRLSNWKNEFEEGSIKAADELERV